MLVKEWEEKRRTRTTRRKYRRIGIEKGKKKRKMRDKKGK